MASTVVVATLVTGTSLALASGDDGENGDGSGPLVNNVGASWHVEDNNYVNPTADTLAMFVDRASSAPMTRSTQNMNRLQQVIDGAVANCQANYIGTSSPDCRLVAVGVAQYGGKWGYDVTYSDSQGWKDAFDSEVQGKTYTNGKEPYTADTQFQDRTGWRSMRGQAYSLVDYQFTQSGIPSIMAIVYDRDHPVPRDYHVTITTEAHAPADKRVGSTEPVFDTLHVTNDAEANDHIGNATVTLNYDGQPNGYVAAKSAAKLVDISSTGTFTSPQFTPADLGMSHWQEGKYWFDVHVDKQGNMADTVDTQDRVASESWDIVSTPLKRVNLLCELGEC